MAPLVGIKFESGEKINFPCSEAEFDLLNNESAWCHISSFLKQRGRHGGAVVEICPGGYSEPQYIVVCEGVQTVAQPSDRQTETQQSSEAVPEPEPSGSEQLLETVADCDPDSPPLPNGNKSWSVTRVRLLIALFEEHRHMLTNNLVKKKDVWRIISERLNATGGAQFSYLEVDKKWRSLKARYKKIVDSHNSTGQGRTAWIHLEEMDRLFTKDPVVYPPCVITAGVSTSTHKSSSSLSSSPSAGQKKGPVQSSAASTALHTIKKHNRKMVAQLKRIADSEERRNELFEMYLNKL